MKQTLRIKVISLIGIILIFLTTLYKYHLHDTRANFIKCQQIVEASPGVQEIIYNNVAFRSSSSMNVYTLAVESDIRYYPNKYIVITQITDDLLLKHKLFVELVSGPGPENVVTISNNDAMQYLATMKLRLLH